MDLLSTSRDYLEKEDYLGLYDYLLSQDDFDGETFIELVSLLQGELERVSLTDLDLREHLMKIITFIILQRHKDDPETAISPLRTTLRQLLELGKSYFVSSNYFKAE